jgi:hypothetical protein
MVKKIIGTIALMSLLLAAACSIDPAGTERKDSGGISVLTVADENEPIVIPDGGALPETRWSCPTHTSITSIAAIQWGLSAARASVMSDASDYPDTYQAGLDNGYNQQWSHAYIYDNWFGRIFYLWGDAHEDFNDNLVGPVGGEGYNGMYAGYYYERGNQYTGDQYAGYAFHFIQDVSIVLHSTAPDSLGLTVPYYTVDMLTNHFNFENWVNNNLTAGHRFLDAVAADYYYYPITDLKKAVKNAAWASCAYKGTSSVGYSAWTEYRKCGYPTGAGTGTAKLVENTKIMLIAAGRYTKGAIKYALDRYGQWSSTY